MVLHMASLFQGGYIMTHCYRFVHVSKTLKGPPRATFHISWLGNWFHEAPFFFAALAVCVEMMEQLWFRESHDAVKK